MNHSFAILTLVLAGAALIAGVGLADQSAATGQDVTPPRSPAHTTPLGVSGYSPVSYLTRGRAEPGSPLHKAVYEGVTYFMTDAGQVKAFKVDPERYLPAYGGFCAFGCSVDSDFVPDPTSFEVIDGRTHLFLKNEEVDARALWHDADQREVRSKADAYWERKQAK